MGNQSSLTQLRGVDLIKYIMAIGVITIHVGAIFDGDATFSDVVVWWMRSAVPFFFIVSGFLIARKNQGWGSQQFYIDKAKSVYRIFGYWLLIYLPVAAVTYWQLDYGLIKSIKSYIVGIFTYGQCPGAPLWYIYALGGFMLTMYLGCRFRVPVSLTVVWFVLIYYIDYCVSEGVIDATNLVVKWFYLLTRRLFGGGVYLLSGMSLYFFRQWTTNWTVCLFATLLSIMLFSVEAPFWELLSGVAFFILALKIFLPQGKVWMYMRNQSMWIYFTHMLSIFIIVQISRLVGYELQVLPTLIASIILTLLLTNVIALFKRRFPVLQYLISS